MITSPSEVRLLFILLVSNNLSPVDLETLNLSDPAKSIKFKVPSEDFLYFLFYPFIVI